MASTSQIPRLVAITTAGYFFSSQQGIIYGWDTDSQLWVSVFEDERLGSGSVLDSDDHKIIFGTPTGLVFVFLSEPGPSLKLLMTHKVEGVKIYSLHLVASEQMIACLDNGRMVLMNLIGDGESQPSTRFVLPEGKQRWPSCILATHNRFMIGDREGSLHLYTAEKEVVAC